jgi:hypothetical protein
MDYGKLIGKQLTAVFKKTVSLQIDVVFHLKSEQKFDYKSGSVSAKDKVTPAKALVVSTTQKLDMVKRQLLIQRIDQLDLFDKVTMDGQEWTLGQTIVDNGYTQIVEVYHG